jgi:mRNA interferase MazF
MVVKRFEIYLATLDPAVGMEMQKTRPCLVVSPDELNRYLRTVIVAPMTTKTHAYPTRIRCEVAGKTGEVALDQLRVLDRSRLVRRIGTLDDATQAAVLQALQALFAP